MAFPARDYYSLKSLQKRWNAPWDDVTYAVEMGHLRACVHLPTRWMEYGHYEEGKFIVDKSTICDGMVAIQPKDTRRIFARGENTVCVFQSIRRSAYLLRLAAEPPQKLMLRLERPSNDDVDLGSGAVLKSGISTFQAELPERDIAPILQKIMNLSPVHDLKIEEANFEDVIRKFLEKESRLRTTRGTLST